MKQFITILFLLFVSLGFSQTGPGGVGNTNGTSSLDIWLRGEAGVEEAVGNPAEDLDNVTFWRDQSGNGNDAQQLTVADKPNLDTTGMGGRPAINFDLSNTEFLTDNYTFGEDVQIIIVASSNVTNWSSYGFLGSARGGNGVVVHPRQGTRQVQYYSVNSGGGYSYMGVSTPPSILVPNIFFQTIDHTAGIIAYDVGYNGSSTTGTVTHARASSTQDIYLGRDNCCGSRYMDGKIAEMIYYNQKVNSAQKILIDNYLAAKYGIALNFFDLYNEDDASAGNYDFDVAGIGRIDASNLHTDAQGTGIVRILNASGLDNDEFFIWGHDNGEPHSIELGDVPPTVDARFERVWRVSEVSTTGTAADVGAIDLRFDLSNFTPVTTSDLRLLIDTDNDGLFSDETPIAGATSLGGGIYQFAGVSALANNLRFTIGTINSLQTPLPIELTQFSAKATDNKYIVLNWQTASEINNDFFAIERSVNGIDWDDLKRVSGAGNSTNVLNYSEIDSAPYSGTSYYRLKQTDFDGEFTYSPIRSVQIDGITATTIEIYPNPALNEITIVGKKSEMKSVRFYSSLGQDITALTIRKSSNENQIKFDVSNLSRGIYYLQTENTFVKFSKR